MCRFTESSLVHRDTVCSGHPLLHGGQEVTVRGQGSQRRVQHVTASGDSCIAFTFMPPPVSVIGVFSMPVVPDRFLKYLITLECTGCHSLRDIALFSVVGLVWRREGMGPVRGEPAWSRLLLVPVDTN